MKKSSKLLRYLIPAAIALIGVCLIVYGVTDGECGAVLRKAIAICMECIGIG